VTLGGKTQTETSDIKNKRRILVAGFNARLALETVKGIHATQWIAGQNLRLFYS
jgi:hypothetical protein